jgi:multiple sugar transport system substrate-binding protein
MPAGKSSTSFIGGSNIAVFKDAKNRDAAWKFLAWLSKPDVQVKWYQAVSDLPAVQSAWTDPALAGDKILQVFGEQLKSAKAPPPYPTWEQVSAVLDTEVEKVCIGGEDPATALKKVQQQADAIGTGL